MELSRAVVTGFALRVLKAPMCWAFGVWHASTLAQRAARAAAEAHHMQRLCRAAWAAMRQRAAQGRQRRHLL